MLKLFYSNLNLIHFLLLHIFLIGILSFICFMFLNKERRNFLSLVFLFGLGFSSSIFGYILLLLITFYLRKIKLLPYTKIKVSFPLEEMILEGNVLPYFKKLKIGESGINFILKLDKASLNLKEQVLKIISEAKSASHFGLIQKAFPFLEDEVRFQAYSLLAKTEKAIMKNISNLKNLLAITKDKKELSAIHLKIANSYWDLLLFNLVEELLKEEILKLAFFHINESISLYPRIEAYFLAGKICLKIGNYSQAEKYLLMVYSEPYYKFKAIPYLAEVYFYYKNFEKVKELLSELNFVADTRIAFIKELWVG